MPSGKTARPNITDNKDGTVTVRYAPTEKGLHEMDIRYDGNHIPGETTGSYWELLGATGRWPPPCLGNRGLSNPRRDGVSPWGEVFDRRPHVSPGSPLQFYVDAINPRHVSAYGPGLSHGMVNKPCTFTIVTKDAGEGERWPKGSPEGLEGLQKPLPVAMGGS